VLVPLIHCLLESVANMNRRLPTTTLLLAIASMSPTVRAGDIWMDAWSRAMLSTTVTRETVSIQPTVPVQFSNQTYRLIAFTTLGGSRVRVKIDNASATSPLNISEVHLALRDSEGGIKVGTDRVLRFKDNRHVTLQPGEQIWSDPVTLIVAKHTDVAVSMYLPGTFTATAFHPTGLKTSYLSKAGNYAASTTMPASTTTPNTTMVFFVSQIQVQANQSTRAIVALGDSITDGACSDVDANGGWPEQLSKRLGAAPIAVINAGIGSNRFTASDGAGLRGLQRLPELLKRTNVKWLIVLEGVNDISYEHITPNDLIAAYKTVIEQAHAANIKVFGVPILPFGNSRKDVDNNDQTRVAVNAWIRTSSLFDNVIDFEPLLADPADPSSIRTELTCDHVHPNQAGYQTMASAIDLNLFQ
jgi:lysophospholipase L1-like esterase